MQNRMTYKVEDLAKISENAELKDWVKEGFYVSQKIDTSDDFNEFVRELARVRENPAKIKSEEKVAEKAYRAENILTFNVYGEEFECYSSDTPDELVKKVAAIYAKHKADIADAKKHCEEFFRSINQLYFGPVHNILSRGLVQKAMDEKDDPFFALPTTAVITVHFPQRKIVTREQDYIVKASRTGAPIAATIHNDSVTTFQLETVRKDSSEKVLARIQSVEVASPYMSDVLKRKVTPEFSQIYKRQYTPGPALSLFNKKSNPIISKQFRKAAGWVALGVLCVGVSVGIAAAVSLIPVAGHILAPFVMFAGVVGGMLCVGKAKATLGDDASRLIRAAESSEKPAEQESPVVSEYEPPTPGATKGLGPENPTASLVKRRLTSETVTSVAPSAPAAPSVPDKKKLEVQTDVESPAPEQHVDSPSVSPKSSASKR